MFVYEEEEEWADEDDIGGQARPGTTKRKQYYTKKVRQVRAALVFSKFSILNIAKFILTFFR